MHELPTVVKTERLVALDALRGITIAGMIVVNNPGSWKYVYGPLQHAPWNGWTPTDLVFPFFLFIVGVAMAFSLQRRLDQGADRVRLVAQAGRRAAILILLGLIMAGYPDPVLVPPRSTAPAATMFSFAAIRAIGPYLLFLVGLIVLFLDQPVLRFGPGAAVVVRKAFAVALLVAAIIYFALDWRHFESIIDAKNGTQLRVPGVLQRIGLCYFFVSLILLWCNVWGRAAIGTLLLIGYWVLVTNVHPPTGYDAPVTDSAGLLHDWIDTRLLGMHIYSERPDPEGLLSTLPAIATVLAGVLTGQWLQRPGDKIQKVIGLFIAANVLLVLGLWAACVFPINKKIWTSSYVLVTAGVALHFLALCYWLIDLKGFRKWAWPFVVFGSNAIVVYVAASMTAKTLGITKFDDKTSVKGWLYDHAFASWCDPTLASLLFAVTYVALWLIPMVPLYRKRIFIKV